MKPAVVVFLLAFAFGLGCVERVPYGFEPFETLADIKVGEVLPLEIAVPDSARTGEPFEISVVTYTGNTCNRKGRTVVEAHAERLAARVLVYTIIGPGPNCGDVLASATHLATLTFLEPGKGTVTVVGMVDGRVEAINFDVHVDSSTEGT